MTELKYNKDELYEILSSYPKTMLVEVFEKLFVSYDDSPLSSDEIKEVNEAKEAYNNDDLIDW